MKSRNILSANHRYSILSELGSKLRLSFSSMMQLGKTLIGLDGLNRKLIVLEHRDGKDQHSIIDMNSVTGIVLKKTYRSIPAGQRSKRKVEEFLERVQLQFEHTGAEPFLLTFYERQKSNAQESAKYERNARSWQLILSKMSGAGKDKDLQVVNLREEGSSTGMFFNRAINQQPVF
jgi:hypothetical protein